MLLSLTSSGAGFYGGSNVAGSAPVRPGARWQALLERICEQAVERLDVEHASVGVVTSSTEWSPGAASSPTAAALEESAFALGEGPCVDAVRDHVPVFATDLSTAASARRWPSWTLAAERLDVHSTAVFPVQAGALVAGVLSVYSSVPWQPTASQVKAAQALVDATLMILLDIVSTAADRDGGSQAEHGDSLSVLLRGDVHRAAGMVMAQAGVRIDEALALLRARAFATGRPLPEVAADVLARRIRIDRA